MRWVTSWVLAHCGNTKGCTMDSLANMLLVLLPKVNGEVLVVVVRSLSNWMAEKALLEDTGLKNVS